MSITVSLPQERVLSMPEFSSVICADLPVHQERLDAAQMAQAEGGFSWCFAGAIILSGAIVWAANHIRSGIPKTSPQDLIQEILGYLPSGCSYSISGEVTWDGVSIDIDFECS